MIANDIRKIIESRKRLDTHDAFRTEECWNAEIQTLTADIKNTLHFFESECSDDELFWLSEVFEKVSKILQSKDFANILRKRLSKITRESYAQSILSDEFMKQNISYEDFVDVISMEIDFAEGVLET